MAEINTSASVSSSTGVDGNSFTTAVSNDNLTNEDFITLMLTELSLQDPTKPVDSASMMDTQLQMSTIEANMATIEAMNNLTASFAQTTLSDSANMIGKIVENGSLNEDDELKQYQVSSVESQDGTIYATAYEIIGYDDIYYFEPIEDAQEQIENGNDEEDSLTITMKDGSEHTFSTENKTYEELAEEIASIDGLGADIVDSADGQKQLIIAVNGASSSFTQNGLEMDFSKDQQVIFNSEADVLEYASITKVY